MRRGGACALACTCVSAMPLLSLSIHCRPNTISAFLSVIYQYITEIDWGCRKHQPTLCRKVRTPTINEYPRYDTKQSNCEALVMLALWGMSSLLSPLWPEVVAPDKVLSMG